MKKACLLFSALLLLEGLLAWLTGGEALLLVAGTAGLLLYAALRRAPPLLAEGGRLFMAALMAVAGPLHYQQSLTALLLCFLAVPHFLAATQALLESDSTTPSAAGSRRTAIIFSVAFYAALGLVYLLGKGLAPALPAALTTTLAVLVLVAALAAWELSRVPRLRAATTATGFSWQGAVGSAALLGLAALCFSGPLPWAAGQLTRLSPHWRMDPVAFKNKPPHPPPAPVAAGTPASSGIASRLGMDESSVTGEHRLPARSDLQSTEGVRFLVRMESPGATPAGAVVYLRSHTLNRYRDNTWTPEVSGGVWLTDAADGAEDGRITLERQPAVPALTHEVFAFEADGYTLPALPGLTEIFLPRVYAVPGDVLQSPATGDIRYRAVSAPALWTQLADPALLVTALPPDRVHLQKADGPLGIQLERLASSIFGQDTLLHERVRALQQFLARHYRYSTVMKNPHGLAPLENFLFDERAGHCDFYASAAALLLRAGGIPTRIAYGFASRERDSTSGLLIFRDRHAHAWTELYLKKTGWTVCDFTPESAISPTAEGPAPPPLQVDLKQFGEAAKDALPQPPATPGSPLLLTKLSAWLTHLSASTGALQRLLPWLPALLCGPALLAAALRWWPRKAPPGGSAAAALDEEPGYYQEWLRLTAAAGHPKPPGRTPLEHFHHLQQAGFPVAPLTPVIRYHCATRYENAARDPAAEQHFLHLLTETATQLRPPPAA